jgi:hypothetical protein
MGSSGQMPVARVVLEMDSNGKGSNGKEDRVQNTDFRIQRRPLNSEICILNSVIFAVPTA